MKYAYIVAPVGRRNNATSFVQGLNITFETHLWRKGIPDPDIDTFDNAIELAPESNLENTTKLMLWGQMTDNQATDLDNNNVQGLNIYYAEDGWDRDSVMREEDVSYRQWPLEQPVDLESTPASAPAAWLGAKVDQFIAWANTPLW